MNQIPIADATDDQLRWHAANVLGLDTATVKRRSRLIGLIDQAWDKDYVLSNDEPMEAEDQTEVPTVHVAVENDFTSVMSAPKITIKVMQTGGLGGKDDVYVNVQTKPLRIKRGAPVAIPYPFYEALMHAVPSVTRQASDDDYELVETEASNYPVQVLEPVDMPAWKAWEAAVAQKSLWA